MQRRMQEARNEARKHIARKIAKPKRVYNLSKLSPTIQKLILVYRSMRARNTLTTPTVFEVRLFQSVVTYYGSHAGSALFSSQPRHLLGTQ